MKKLISFFIAVALIVTAMPVFANTVEDDAINADAALAKSSAELLAAVGVIPGFSDQLSDGVSRADFLNCIIASLKLGLSDNTSENTFYDVTASDSFCSAVNYALDLGIISEGTYFRPHDIITYAEAAKMIISALGYDINAQLKGGYPFGYIAMADSLDLNVGFSADINAQLNSAQSCIMIANMLESDIRMAAAIISDNGDYSVRYREGANILTLLYDWYEVSGVVSGDSTTHLYDNSSDLSDGFISIGSDEFYCTQSPVLGLYVEGYAKSQGNREVIKYLKTDSDSILELLPGNYPSYKRGVIEFTDDDGEDDKASLESMLAVVYNGKAYADYVASDFAIDVGKLVLVDSDDNNLYDVVHIYNGEIVVADVVNTDSRLLVDSFTKNVIDYSDEENFVLYEDGVLGDLSYITQGAVMEYFLSKDGSFASVNLLTGSVSGKVSGTSEGAIYIDDVKYDYAPYFANRYMNNVTVGADNTFVCTADNVIVAVETLQSSSSQLAYAYKSKISSGLDSKVGIKAIVQDGTTRELELADKVNINDNANLSAAEVYNTYFSGSEGCIMRYRENADGRVFRIQFASQPEASQDLSVYDVNSESKDMIKPYVIEGVADTSMVSYKIFGVFVPYFTIDSETVVFCIDPNENKTDEERYTVGSTNSWANDVQMSFGSIKPYNVTSSGRAEILVVHAGQNTAIDDNSVYGGVVESVTRALDAHGDEALKITMAAERQFATIYLSKNHDSYSEAIDVDAKTDIDVGDYICCVVDEYNNIVTYRKDFDYNESTLSHPGYSDDNQVLVYYYGTLGTVQGSCFSVDLINATGPTKSGKVNFAAEAKGACVVDVANQKVSTISLGQAMSYMNQGYKVLLRTRYYSVRELIIYKTK